MRDSDVDPNRLNWAKGNGLLPAIVQHWHSGEVLMLGYMNAVALAQTQATRRVTFYSRSRRRLWTKGESSGHFLHLRAIEADCDGDTLLIQAEADGPTCHLGRTSCFAAAPEDFLGALDAFIAKRQRELPEGSYTTRLFEAGIKRIAQKVGEEGVETALAAATGDANELRNEAADLLYHLIALLRAAGLSLDEARNTLARRHAESETVK